MNILETGTWWAMICSNVSAFIKKSKIRMLIRQLFCVAQKLYTDTNNLVCGAHMYSN